MYEAKAMSIRHALIGRLKGLKSVAENKKIVIGFCVIMGIFLFSEIGSRLSPYDPRVMGNVSPNLPPSWKHPLGSDPYGRDLFSQLTHGTALSLKIAFSAGTLAFLLALCVSLIGGYYGGGVDNILGITTEVFITLPSFAILILLAAVLGSITVPLLCLILGILSWAWPSKVIRALTISLKDRGFVKIAKLSGYNGIEIVMREILPNMLPFLGAWYAFVVNGTMLTEVGLELIGLAPPTIVTLGTMLNWSMRDAAFTRNLTNWWLPPCLVLITNFVSIFVISMGLDEIGNPRLRKIK